MHHKEINVFSLKKLLGNEMANETWKRLLLHPTCSRSVVRRTYNTLSSIVVVHRPDKQEMQGWIPYERDYPFVPLCYHSITLLFSHNSFQHFQDPLLYFKLNSLCGNSCCSWLYFPVTFQITNQNWSTGDSKVLYKSIQIIKRLYKNTDSI